MWALGPIPGEASFVDGSARGLLLNELQDGYHNGDYTPGDDDIPIHTFDFPYALHTIDGVRGRDVK